VRPIAVPGTVKSDQKFCRTRHHAALVFLSLPSGAPSIATGKKDRNKITTAFTDIILRAQVAFLELEPGNQKSADIYFGEAKSVFSESAEQ
jgi:hypothetical protein